MSLVAVLSVGGIVVINYLVYKGVTRDYDKNKNILWKIPKVFPKNADKEWVGSKETTKQEIEYVDPNHRKTS